MKKWLTAITLVLTLGLVYMPVNAKEPDTYIDKEYQKYIYKVAGKYHICPELVMAIVETESSGNPDAINGDCVGLMQVSKTSHTDRIKRLKVKNLYDPYSNILVGCDYLAELFEDYGELPTVLMIYNGTSTALDRSESFNYTDYAELIMERSYNLERIHGK